MSWLKGDLGSSLSSYARWVGVDLKGLGLGFPWPSFASNLQRMKKDMFSPTKSSLKGGIGVWTGASTEVGSLGYGAESENFFFKGLLESSVLSLAGAPFGALVESSICCWSFRLLHQLGHAKSETYMFGNGLVLDTSMDT
nr:hypothetical protein Iba_chr12aCG9790 [Ipomoea batatas]